MSQDTLKRSVYAAVGIPTYLVVLSREQVSCARGAISEFRDRLPGEAHEVFDGFADEGEKVVATIGDRVRDTRDSIEETVRRRTAMTEDVTRGLGATLTEPIVPIDEVDGIGPVYADELAAAGVISTRALLERCRSEEALLRLADQTGIAAGLLEKWVGAVDLTRINGIGEEHMSLLNRLGIGSLEVMARADAADLRARALEIEEVMPQMSAVPGEATLTGWIRDAGRLAT